MDRGGERWKTEAAHRVSWELSFGPVPEGLCVLHKCDNPPCVRPDHLFLGTHKNNAEDRDRKGRGFRGRIPENTARQRGSKNQNAKLDEQKVIAIREEYAAGEVSQTALAEKNGVNQTKISDVVCGRTWSHVGGPITKSGRGRLRNP